MQSGRLVDPRIAVIAEDADARCVAQCLAPAAGFSCTQGCDGLELSNNKSWGNHTHGFLLRRCDAPSLFEGNEASENLEAGIALIDCSGNQSAVDLHVGPG